MMRWNGSLRAGKHLFNFVTYYEQGGGIEEYVAWCLTCDIEGKDTINVDVRGLSDEQAQAKVLLGVANHILEA